MSDTTSHLRGRLRQHASRTRDNHTYVADSNELLGDSAREAVGQAILGGDNCIDEIHLEGNTLEEHVAVCRITVGFQVDRRQIWLWETGQPA